MKKILLFLGMFLFIFNVKALTFNVNITEINDLGNNGTLGSITNIDLENKELDAYFQDIGDEVRFEIVITNSGDRAGTLRSITITSSSDKMEYTTSLPENGLAINGNDTNGVAVIAKVLPGATNGTSSTELKITYNYDEGSCPEGEILSDDESMCLCPAGMERNETGICVTPEKPVECKDDEIYNETKKICEKKVVPVNPSNPKTMDNIILITLLFVVSGLGIYAVMFKKLKTNKKKVVAGVITGVTTLALSFTVLASVFGLDNLLSAIVNPITKSKELVVTVNETLDLIETWDGDCDVTGALTPDNVFEGGSGTESDPYQIKTANQLACFAKSVNEGNTYEGKFIKQTKNIKLNDNLNDQAEAGDLSNAHVWISAGYKYWDDDAWENIIKSFNGTYDGDNKIISGLYLTNDSIPYNQYSHKGLFGYATNATFKNMILSDVYYNTGGNTGALLGYAFDSLTVDNVTTFGTGVADGWDGAGVVSNYSGNNNAGTLTITNTTNNMDLTCNGSGSGIIHRMEDALVSDEPTIIFRNNTNTGDITFTGGPSIAGGLFGYVNTDGYLVCDNNVNTGTLTNTVTHGGGNIGGIFGQAFATTAELTNSHNTGDMVGFEWSGSSGMLYGSVYANTVTVDNSYNSGDYTPSIELTGRDSSDYFGGIVGYISARATITNCYNTGDLSGNISYLAGIVAKTEGSTIENCYNTGDLLGYGYVGGIFSYGTNTTINKTYNTGTINTTIGPMSGGIVGYSATTVTNSYNTGTIINNGGGYTGGICGHYCNTVKNCYNRGDVIANNSPTDIGGITGYGMDEVENCYNSGNVIYPNTTRYGNSGYVAGISAQGGTVKNSYNLGDVVFHLISVPNAYEPNPHVDGIATYASANGCVNTGKVTLVADEPLESPHLISMDGISYYGGNNNFNAGELVIDDSALTTPIRQDGLSHSIRLGQITEGYTAREGNKFNTDPNNKAIGCYGIWPQCTDEASLAVGVYTTEEAPSILSIINGDNAYNDELDDDGLPTLRAFNE